MSFVITSGSKQYLVKSGQRVIVDRLDAPVDSVVELPVSYSSNPSTKTIKAVVVAHQKGTKIRVVKYRAKSNYHRQYGYRHFETVLKIEGEYENTSPKKKNLTISKAPKSKPKKDEGNRTKPASPTAEKKPKKPTTKSESKNNTQTNT